MSIFKNLESLFTLRTPESQDYKLSENDIFFNKEVVNVKLIVELVGNCKNNWCKNSEGRSKLTKETSRRE